MKCYVYTSAGGKERRVVPVHEDHDGYTQGYDLNSGEFVCFYPSYLRSTHAESISWKEYNKALWSVRTHNFDTCGKVGA